MEHRNGLNTVRSLLAPTDYSNTLQIQGAPPPRNTNRNPDTLGTQGAPPLHDKNGEQGDSRKRKRARSAGNDGIHSTRDGTKTPSYLRPSTAAPSQHPGGIARPVPTLGSTEQLFAGNAVLEGPARFTTSNNEREPDVSSSFDRNNNNSVPESNVGTGTQPVPNQDVQDWLNDLSIHRHKRYKSMLYDPVRGTLSPLRVYRGSLHLTTQECETDGASNVRSTPEYLDRKKLTARRIPGGVNFETGW